MDFFNKVGETVTEKSKIVADKAKQVAEIASLKGQISSNEDVIKKNYAEIGRIYYEAHKDFPDVEFAQQCNVISDAEVHTIKLEENQIKNIKGV